MPKRSSNTGFSHRLRRIGRANLYIIAAFVLIFAGAGTLFVARSEAATWYCTQHEYYYYEPGTIGGGCVKNIQNILNHMSYAHHTHLSVDGVYGTATKNDIYYLQVADGYKQVYGKNPDGVVGANSWHYLCDYAHYYIADYYHLYDASGCGNLPYASHPVQ